jgi:YegS/Rv2252/BmrU family lipid kinase
MAMSRRRKAVVIARARSRRGRDAAAAIPDLLRERGVDVTDVVVVKKRRELRKAIRGAMKRGFRLIVVCGGDGTITSSVPLFARKRFTLGIVPAGTGNSFALGLGIDSFERAADAIAYGREERVDLGMVNGEYFANFLTVGLAAEIAGNTPRALKSALGAAAYGAAAVGPLVSHRPFRATVRWKRKRVDVETHQIIVASGRFYGHQPLAPYAKLDDGRATVFVRDRTSTLNVVQTYWALLRGTQADLDGARVWSTRRTLKIRTAPKAPVSVDGCAFGFTPIRIEIARCALRVMTPPAQEDSAAAS